MTKQEISNMDIALYALYLLGGMTKKIPTEDITLKCFKLYPSRFSWILYPQYPDIEPTRKTLFDARSHKNGALVSGRHGITKENQISDGWIFTPAGIKWIENHKEYIEHVLGENNSIGKRTKTEKKVYELEKSVAFKIFLKENNLNNIKPYEFTDFLNASLDTPSAILKDRVSQAKAIAATNKKVKLIKFIELAEEKFSDLFN